MDLRIARKELELLANLKLKEEKSEMRYARMFSMYERTETLWTIQQKLEEISIEDRERMGLEDDVFIEDSKKTDVVMKEGEGEEEELE